MTIEELMAMLKKNAAEIKAKQEAMDLEIKSNGKVSVETKSALDLAKSSQAETKAALELAQTDHKELKSTLEIMDKKLIDLELESKRLKESAPKEYKSAGELLIKSDEFSSLASSVKNGGMSYTLETKDISTGSSSAGALVNTYRDPTVYRDPNRPLRIRDLISSVSTSTGAVEFMRQNVFTNNAGPQNGELTDKAKSEITWELISLAGSTIAHHVIASRQSLSDAPMLRSLIDVDLNYGLQLESDVQLLSGTGSGGDMTGLLVDSDIPTVGEIATGTSAGDVPAAMIDHIRAAVTQCQTNEYYNMTGVVLNPTDWATLETAKATDGHYLMIQFPANGGEERIWKMPVVVTNAMPADNFILGDWMMGAKIYDRESLEIRVSESHDGLFIKNGVAILAEERYTLGIQRPKAFCKGLFTVA